MTTFTLERAETQHTPAARCIFAPNGKSVEVTMLHLTSEGWGETMGRGSGFYTVKHAREFYAALLGRGYAAAWSTTARRERIPAITTTHDRP